MENVLIALFALAAILLVIFLVALSVPEKKKPESRHDPDHAPNRKKRPSYDWRGFDHNHIHKNGTKYDEEGYDYFGYDKDGYSRHGYNRLGRNAKKQYNRLFDTTSCQEEGFFDPARYPIGISSHAVERFSERLGVTDPAKAKRMTVDAYKYGKSKRQIKKTSAYLVEEIIYHFGQRERILWREIYGICLQGSWIGAGQGLPRYEIAYPRQGKRPFFLAGEIAKTAKTTKYIKKYYPKEIV